METNFDFLLTIPAEIRSYFLAEMPNLGEKILHKAVLPAYDSSGVDSTGRLRKGFEVEVERISQFVVGISINNIAYDKHYTNEYYWNVIDKGRKSQSSFKGTREQDPFRKSLDNWADAKGFTGNRFWLARNVNERGIKGKPEVFNKIINKSEEFISTYVDEIIGGI